MPGVLTEAGTDKVATTTIPYAAPEAMGFTIDRVVILDASMDVWSMAIVLMQAITRLTMGPTEGDVRDTTVHVVSLDGSRK